MNPKIATIAVLFVLSFGSIMVIAAEQKPALNPEKTVEPAEDSKAPPLDFLADIPSLKTVSLRMSESALLEILKSHKLKGLA